ncbi:hypothetical protein HY491_01040 [Candidatus Woesearchaeota archaeon]|nr:hypothetical protein [Candidatus Woesearchaeota archaeon]
MAILTILAGIGFLLSAYALRVEQKSRASAYHPVCDISEQISCTKAFSSPYGRIAGLPNSVYGLGFYLIAFALAWMQQFQNLVYIAGLAVIGSIYLAYLSYVKIKTYCVVCTSIYLINLLLLIASYYSL